MRFYILATGEILDESDVYVHPITGEKYGKTDFSKPQKLAEIGAVRLYEDEPTEGYCAIEWEIIDHPEIEGAKLRRLVSEELIPQPTEADLATQELSRSDQSFIRVTEDLIDVLIANGTLTASDLPAAVLEKIEARKALRNTIASAMEETSETTSEEE